MVFKVLLQWDSEANAWTATVPELNDICTFGSDKEEALAMAKDMIIGYLEASAGDVLRFLSKKNDVWFPKLKPVPVMGTEKENHTSWERYYRVSDCSSSSRNNWYLGR